MNQREIKFLVWDIDVKRMSTTVHLGDGIVCFPNDTLPIAFCTSRTERFIFRQYTGYKDGKGVKIYEGDVFQGGEYKWDGVEFMDGKFVVNLQDSRLYDLEELFDWGMEKPIVIGNIYQNPELQQSND